MLKIALAKKATRSNSDGGGILVVLFVLPIASLAVLLLIICPIWFIIGSTHLLNGTDVPSIFQDGAFGLGISYFVYLIASLAFAADDLRDHRWIAVSNLIFMIVMIAFLTTIAIKFLGINPFVSGILFIILAGISFIELIATIMMAIFL